MSGDARDVATVHVRAWQAGYRDVLPDAVLDGLSVEERTRNWREWLRADSDDAFTLVAELDGRLVGFCSAATPSRDPDAGPRTAEIGALYVEPASWRVGVGRTLLSAALRRLRRGPWDDMTLWVVDENDRARSFYDRAGFEPDGATKRDEIGPGTVGGGPLQRRLRLRLR